MHTDSRGGDLPTQSPPGEAVATEDVGVWGRILGREEEEEEGEERVGDQERAVLRNSYRTS